MSRNDRQPPDLALRAFLQVRRQDAPTVAGLVVALSGGPDSLTLLLAAARIAPAAGYRLRALHVHHGLHADADAWAARSVAQAAALGLSCGVLRVQVPEQASLEGAARAARHDALAAALAPDEALLLAHHQDDQAETLILRLMRGAGLQGLAGMRPVSRWRAPDGRQVPRWRPWLGLPRAMLAGWLAEATAESRLADPVWPAQALQPVQDPANADPRFDRTLLRHQLMPLLEERWPAAQDQLARCAAHLAAQATALDSLADDWLMRATGPAGTLSLPALTRLDDATLQAVLARWLTHRGASPLPVRHWPRLRPELLLARADAQPCLSWAGWSMRRYREALYLLPDAELQALPDGAADWLDPCQAMQWAGLTWQVAGLAADDPLRTRPWRLAGRRGGERWRPAGGRHSVSVKHWCQSQGIPPWQRERLVCVWAGDVVVGLVLPLASGQAHVFGMAGVTWQLHVQP